MDELKLPPTPGRPASKLRIQIENRLPEILQARESGYTCDQIAAALLEKGISVSGNTLRTYLTRIAKAKQKGKKPEPHQPAPSPAPGASPSATPKPGFALRKVPIE